MSEITPTGIDPKVYADVLAQLNASQSEVAQLKASAVDAISASPVSGLEKQIKDLTKRAEAAEATAKTSSATALNAYRASHLASLGELNNPDAVVLPAVQMADDGSGLHADSIAALAAFKEGNPWAFKVAEAKPAGGNTPLGAARGADAPTTITAADVAGLQAAGVGLEQMQNIPAAALAGLGLAVAS